MDNPLQFVAWLYVPCLRCGLPVPIFTACGWCARCNVAVYIPSCLSVNVIETRNVMVETR
jgi:hypothetical protein